MKNKRELKLVDDSDEGLTLDPMMRSIIAEGIEDCGDGIGLGIVVRSMIDEAIKVNEDAGELDLDLHLMLKQANEDVVDGTDIGPEAADQIFTLLETARLLPGGGYAVKFDDWEPVVLSDALASQARAWIKRERAKPVRGRPQKYELERLQPIMATLWGQGLRDKAEIMTEVCRIYKQDTGVVLPRNTGPLLKYADAWFRERADD